ncbi:MAG: hypothetical protein GPJ52_01945 [Candidatus Heimdallarchaeota archaeon]|nr:hypothetical protein [Candidatus Heimdallarchaeota archaeon]
MSFTKKENEEIERITQEIVDKSKTAAIVFTGEKFISWIISPANERAMRKIIAQVKKELGINLIVRKVGESET